MRSIFLATILLGITPSVGLTEGGMLIPGKVGYAIMPATWFSVECPGEELVYTTSGDEKRIELPRHIRQCLQKAYEDMCSPSEDADSGIFAGLYGPVNLIRDTEHVLWVVPVHLEEGGFAIVFMQKADGSFEKGCLTLGLEGGLPSEFSVPRPAE